MLVMVTSLVDLRLIIFTLQKCALTLLALGDPHLAAAQYSTSAKVVGGGCGRGGCGKGVAVAGVAVTCHTCKGGASMSSAGFAWPVLR